MSLLSWITGIGLGSGNAALIAQRRAEREALIEKAGNEISQHTDHVCDEILSSSIEELVKLMEKRTYSARTVVEVFIKQAILAHSLTNCITEVNFDAALQRADQLDAEQAQKGTISGALHGIPFSLKDQFMLKGKRSVVGYSEWFKKDVQQDDCTIVKIAQSYGAICICKTNVPQTMLSFECRNPAWGQTNNPYSSAHTSGGSSGGEAAILAIGGAAFGLGSDIGGSLRIPTAWCGIYALKPSSNRPWPTSGSADFGPRPTGVAAVAGPMCRSLTDLELLMRLYTEALAPSYDSVETVYEAQRAVQPASVTAVPVLPLRPAWFDAVQAAGRRTPNERKTIRIGYYHCDGVNKTSPACVRGIDIACKALQNLEQVELVAVPSSALQTLEVLKAFVGLTSITEYDFLRRPLGVDQIDPSLAGLLLLPKHPWIRRVIGWFARIAYKDTNLGKLFACSALRFAKRYFDFEYKRDQLKQKVEQDVWNALRLDAIVAPVLATPALPQFGSALLSSMAANTILCNVLGNPATVVPVTRVDKDVDHWSSTLQDQIDGMSTCLPMTSKNLHKQYNPQAQHGLPVAVQIITREFEDERAIGIAKLLDKELANADENHRQSFGPGAWKRYTTAHPSSRPSLITSKTVAKDKHV